MEKSEKIDLIKELYPLDSQIVGIETLNELAEIEDLSNTAISYEAQGGDNMDFTGALELISLAFSIILAFIEIKNKLKKPSSVEDELREYLRKKNKTIREEEFEVLIKRLTAEKNDDQ